MPKLTARLIARLTAPDAGNRIFYDNEVTGLGLRITARGNRAFVYRYRFEGCERIITIGACGTGALNLTQAKHLASKLRFQIASGYDPLAQRIEAREAATVNDLCRRFTAEHFGKLRSSTAAGYASMIECYIKPAFGNKKVKDVDFADIDALHRKTTQAGHPYRANRTLALLSKMFSLAVKWQMRDSNPARGVQRNQEIARKRYLNGKELAQLSEALAAHEDQQGADVVRLLLLTGARSAEVRSMRWDQVDFEIGVWTKPGSATKQKTEHRVPLSAPAQQLLAGIRNDSEYVFPSRTGEYRASIQKSWAIICKAANIEGCRIHDLRHTYASVLVSSGLSLPIIGALLGHTLASTTQRYAHLSDDPLRRAAETAAAVITGNGQGAEIVPLRKGS